VHSIRIVDGTQVFLLFAGYRQIGLACRHKNLDTGADGVIAQSDSITHTFLQAIMIQQVHMSESK